MELSTKTFIRKACCFYAYCKETRPVLAASIATTPRALLGRAFTNSRNNRQQRVRGLPISTVVISFVWKSSRTNSNPEIGGRIIASLFQLCIYEGFLYTRGNKLASLNRFHPWKIIEARWLIGVILLIVVIVDVASQTYVGYDCTVQIEDVRSSSRRLLLINDLNSSTNNQLRQRDVMSRNLSSLHCWSLRSQQDNYVVYLLQVLIVVIYINWPAKPLKGNYLF